MHVGLPSLPRGLTSLFTTTPPTRRNNVVDIDSPVSTKKRMQTHSSDEEILAFEQESLTKERERAAICAKQLEETLKNDSLAKEMFQKGQADAKAFEKKKQLAEKKKAEIAAKMAELEKEGQNIAEGKRDSSHCPMCMEKLVINTGESGDMSIWCPNKCNLPFIFHVSQKLSTLARFLKRMDPRFQGINIPTCHCDDKIRLVECKSEKHSSINGRLFYASKKKQQDGPCTFGLFVEKLKPKHEDRRDLLTKTYVNRTKLIIRESKANQESAANTFKQAYDEEPVGDIDWSKFRFPDEDEEEEEEGESST